MALLARYRRCWGLVLLALLAVPMAVQSTQPAAQSSGDEARMLSPAPAWPRSLDQWLALPRGFDRFFADHFGLRRDLVRLHGRVRYAIDLPSDLRVIIGRDNWLFLNGDGTIEQSTGKVLREAAIVTFADRAAALHAHLAARSARLVVAIPPNGSTVNRARLPAWAGELPAGRQLRGKRVGAALDGGRVRTRVVIQKQRGKGKGTAGGAVEASIPVMAVAHQRTRGMVRRRARRNRATTL